MSRRNADALALTLDCVDPQRERDAVLILVDLDVIDLARAGASRVVQPDVGLASWFDAFDEDRSWITVV